MSPSKESAIIIEEELLNKYRTVKNCLLWAVDFRVHLESIVLRLFIVIKDLAQPLPSWLEFLAPPRFSSKSVAIYHQEFSNANGFVGWAPVSCNSGAADPS